jgi:hypothetical protein
MNNEELNPLLAASRRDEFLCIRRQKTRPCGTPLKGIFAIFLTLSTWTFAGTITIQLPADIAVAKATAATEKQPQTTLIGTIADRSITFTDPIPGSAYEVQLTLKNGTVLQGVDMNWYSRVPDKADAEPLNDDDIQQMKAVFTAGAQFFDLQEATIIKGNHNRAVMLVRCERTNKFHSDKGDEIIWRPELWYFENHHGGWEKVLQTDRVLRRERFATHEEYHAVVDKLRWVQELGGLKSTPKQPDVKVTLPPHAGVATLSPTSAPSAAQQP